MRRLHLFEFGDQPWFPQLLRDIETAYLSAAYRLLPLPKQWAEKIATVLDRSKPAEIVDLCSGSGGVMPIILEYLEQNGYDACATLTDLYPNPTPVSHPRISSVPEPVDATKVPRELTGARTMFSAFHHFRPNAARAILQDAFESRRAICIFESGSGTLLGSLLMFLVPFNVLLMMLFVRPFRWSFLLFTWLIPIMPLVILWDGLVSMIRIYSPEQMRILTQGMQSPGYEWEIGRMRTRGVPGGLPYLIGRPVS